MRYVVIAGIGTLLVASTGLSMWLTASLVSVVMDNRITVVQALTAPPVVFILYPTYALAILFGLTLKTLIRG